MKAQGHTGIECSTGLNPTFTNYILKIPVARCEWVGKTNGKWLYTVAERMTDELKHDIKLTKLQN